MGQITLTNPPVLIQDWSVVDDVISPAYRDLAQGYRLTGTTLGSAGRRWDLVYSSAILSIDGARGLVETSHTVYQLGQINEHYERWMRQRSLDAAA